MNGDDSLDNSLDRIISLYREQALMERQISGLLKEINLSQQQFIFLYLTKKKGLVTSVKIMRAMGIERAGVSRLISRIEASGLISREVTGPNRFCFRLTKEGDRILTTSLRLIKNSFSLVKK